MASYYPCVPFSRRVVIVLLSIVLVLVLVAGIGYWLASLTPTWYRPPTSSDPSVVQLGETAEYRLVEEFQKIRPDESSWRLRIPEDAINAWLATRLRRWMSGRGVQWPEGVGVPQARLTSHGVTLAVPLAGLGGRFGLFSMVPTFGSGVMVLETSGAVGRLPITFSGRYLRPYLHDALGEQVDSEPMFALLLNKAVVTHLPLADDREVVINNITLEEGAIVLTLSTMSGK